MKCVILAAGYATRMYPLTENLPKSLLVVAGKTILEHILAKVEEVPEIDEIILVSNAKFAGQFREYLKKSGQDDRITLIDDGTWDNEHRLGAVADLGLAIERRQIDDDILVLAGDNLFDFSLADFAAFYDVIQFDCITAHLENRQEALMKTGVAELDSKGRVLSFEEKPKEPKSNFAVPPFYIYKKDTLPLIHSYEEEGNNSDAPGQFVGWLVKRKPIYAYRFTGTRRDIGSLDNYREAQKLFTK